MLYTATLPRLGTFVLGLSVVLTTACRLRQNPNTLHGSAGATCRVSHQSIVGGGWKNAVFHTVSPHEYMVILDDRVGFILQDFENPHKKDAIESPLRLTDNPVSDTVDPKSIDNTLFMIRLLKSKMAYWEMLPISIYQHVNYIRIHPDGINKPAFNFLLSNDRSRLLRPRFQRLPMDLGTISSDGKYGIRSPGSARPDDNTYIGDNYFYKIDSDPDAVVVKPLFKVKDFWSFSLDGKYYAKGEHVYLTPSQHPTLKLNRCNRPIGKSSAPAILTVQSEKMWITGRTWNDDTKGHSLEVCNLTTGQLQTYDGYIFSLGLSSDGSKIIFSDDNLLKVVNVAEESITTLPIPESLKGRFFTTRRGGGYIWVLIDRFNALTATIADDPGYVFTLDLKSYKPHKTNLDDSTIYQRRALTDFETPSPEDEYVIWDNDYILLTNEKGKQDFPQLIQRVNAPYDGRFEILVKTLSQNHGLDTPVRLQIGPTSARKNVWHFILSNIQGKNKKKVQVLVDRDFKVLHTLAIHEDVAFISKYGQAIILHNTKNTHQPHTWLDLTNNTTQDLPRQDLILNPLYAMDKKTKTFFQIGRSKNNPGVLAVLELKNNMWNEVASVRSSTPPQSFQAYPQYVPMEDEPAVDLHPDFVDKFVLDGALYELRSYPNEPQAKKASILTSVSDDLHLDFTTDSRVFRWTTQRERHSGKYILNMGDPHGPNETILVDYPLARNKTYPFETVTSEDPRQLFLKFPNHFLTVECDKDLFY